MLIGGLNYCSSLDSTRAASAALEDEMTQRVNYKCYKCRTYSLTKQGLVRVEGHLYCRPCAKSLQGGQQQLPQQPKVGKRFQTMLDRLLLEK